MWTCSLNWRHNGRSGDPDVGRSDSHARRRRAPTRVMTAVVGGLGAALAWAISTVCSSRSSRLIHPLSVVSWVMITGLVIAAPAAAISGVPARLHGSALAWLVLAGVGNVAGLALEYFALRVGQLGVVAPLISTE